MKKCEQIVRWAVFGCCEAFVIYTIVLQFVQKQYGHLPLAFASLLIVATPAILERLLRCRMRAPVYVAVLLYAIGPMLGQCYALYYTVSWWDKLLHFAGGVVFAIMGVLLFRRLGGDGKKRLLAGLFALCFSMALAAAWEFVEFGSDRFLGTDMQDDTVVTSIHSYALISDVGRVGAIEDIQEVTVNGQPLPFEGYLDIGLMDTMKDMLLETVGALLAVVAYWIGRGRYSLSVPEPKGRSY